MTRITGKNTRQTLLEEFGFVFKFKPFEFPKPNYSKYLNHGRRQR
tara:strand:- start:224 stop:358 length:135 start_codon:yes stop_codon:yes gene_type:complete